jgi:hypothetical protein
LRTVQCAPLSTTSSSLQSIGTDTPRPGLARGDHAATVVAPQPLRS